MKHGLTGQGVVLPREDEAAIEARFAAFEEELGVEGEVGRCLARRAALLSLRLDRAAEHEAAMIARRVRVAEELYDEERRSYVDELADGLREAPTTVVRRLKSMPEGIDWLVGAWKAVRADLMNAGRDLWNGGHWTRIENLMGRRPGDYPAPEIQALCHACWGNFELLAKGQGEGLAPEARRVWARGQLAAWIDERVAELEALRPTLDLSRVAADRADAGRRALFDTSPQAILARKYEAAAERGFFRAMKEIAAIRDLEAQAREIEAEATAIEEGALGSFFPDDGAAETPSPEGDRTPDAVVSGAAPAPASPPIADPSGRDAGRRRRRAVLRGAVAGPGTGSRHAEGPSTRIEAAGRGVEPIRGPLMG